MNPFAGAMLRPTFQTPYSDKAQHRGQPFAVLRTVDPNDSTAEYTVETDVNEVGPLYLIRFADGIETQAYPEEIYTGVSSFEPKED